MTLTVFFILLFAALLHATWNAIVKAGSDKLSAAVSITGSAALIAAVCLPFAPQPALVSAPWLAVSCILQVIYTLLVAKTYQISDMGQTYPLMRGTAPLLVAGVSTFLPGEHLSLLAWAGIGVICLSILMMAMQSRGGSGKGVALALLNACFIASYTLIDGTGVRLSESALGYTLWTFLLNGTCMLAWGFYVRRREVARYMVRHWQKGLLGGVGTLGSYGLALWAMTQAPLAVVAALRETSILFGAAIAVLVLKERVSALRIAAACGIACGAILLRVA
ncbi:DMT family transporter [Pluralibacter gergoviae]|uniref:DMT family transporter n=1 Tax=Pluralibacter gergoviae TaxID=61647 RepID=UPI0006AC74BB|nr:DMT family transporter [Pluralibacter gergoviae]KOQ91037.1 membrane protein [Pluralibacter gergoviae]MCK1069196.1 DMT family transporter [Pluralibacter gergoviae]MCV7761141.1 DMT family transporter [Pluralibacter gergoviae]PHH45270.1 EamA family transporter [Pluralibacter gergoviae]HDS1237216.1 EamA family transporter [Pluralibacter gergoviae]